MTTEKKDYYSASSEAKLDKDFALSYLSGDFSSFKMSHIPDGLKDDKDFMQSLIKKNGAYLYCASERLRNDIPLALEALSLFDAPASNFESDRIRERWFWNSLGKDVKQDLNCIILDIQFSSRFQEKLDDEHKVAPTYSGFIDGKTPPLAKLPVEKVSKSSKDYEFKNKADKDYVDGCIRSGIFPAKQSSLPRKKSFKPF